MRAFRGMKSFREEASFRTWTYRITANCAATLLAERAKHPHLELDVDVPLAEHRPERNPEAAVTSSDDRRRLARALARLPEPLRLVIVLRDIYDLPHSAIARELAITQSAAKVRLHRARRRMRDSLYEAELATPDGAFVVPPEEGVRRAV